jgi:hypothetical protein
VLGSATWTGIVANAGDTDDPASWWSDAANAAALSGFDKTKVPGGLYTATWGTIISSAFFAEDGFTVSFNLGTKKQMIEGLVYDITLESLTATCKCVPVGPALSAIVAALGDADHGVEPPVADLVITGPLGTFTLKNCQARMASGQYGSSVKRVGEIEFVTQRSVTSGLLDALWTLA